MSDFPSSQRDLPGEEKNMIFNPRTTKCSLCPTVFLLGEESGDTPNENVKMRQFLHNLFQQMNLRTMCPCLNPPSCSKLQLPMCKECSEGIKMLWTCDSTIYSLRNTRVGLLESLRQRALLGVLEERKRTRTTAQPPPQPIVIPEMQSLRQIRNAIAFGGMWDWRSNFQLDSRGEANNHNQIDVGVHDPSFQQPTVDSLSSDAQPSTITRMGTSYNVSGTLNAITGAEEKIAGADGQLYGIIKRKYVEGEDDVDIINCFRGIHGQKDRMFYMCRRCRVTVMYKTFRFLKGQVTPYQRMKAHVQNCGVGTQPSGNASPPKQSFLDGDPAAKIKPMPTLKSAPGVKAARVGASKQTNVDTDGTIYKICQGGRGSKLGILTGFRYFEGRLVEELVYMCRYCKFKLAASHKKKLVGPERPFYKMKIHVINCRGQSPQRVAIDYSCKRSNIHDAGFPQGSPTQKQNKTR